jgi:outer membrane protein
MKLIMKRTIVFASLFLFAAAARAQAPRVTLQECIGAALKNNVQVKQGQLDVSTAELNHRQAKSNLLPAVNGNISHGINQGRSIDPFTNTYVNQNINYANYGLSSDVVLYNGMNLRNTARQNAYAADASRMDLQALKDNITLNVIFAYLQVLTNEDVMNLSANRAVITRKQVERLEVLNKQGAISPSQLYDLMGQLKDDELSVATSRNALYSAKLQLTQLMNIPYDSSIRLARVGMEELLVPPAGTAADVYAKAVDQLAVVKSTKLRIQSAEAGLKAARGALFPTLYAAGNLNTNYSSIASRDLINKVQDVTTSAYVNVNGNKVPVITQQYGSEKIPYSNQLKNNIFSNVEVGLRIPLFNSFTSRNRVKQAEITVRTMELAEESAQVQLRQDIEQAHLNMANAWERYRLLQEQVASFTASFRAAEVRFNAGVGTSVDYLIAKNNLDRATANLVIAQYDYLLRKRVLDYYSGAGIEGGR